MKDPVTDKPNRPARRSRERRTQAMRSAETTARLLDATIECLIELGYAGTSTPIVCERAGVSRGALLHHYPTKTELVIAAIAHLVTRVGEKFEAEAPKKRGRGDRFAQSLEMLWESFSGPLFYAALELWVAARTDRELHRHLYDFERRLGRAIRQFLQAQADPDPRQAARYADQIELTLYLLRGMALQRILRPDDGERRRLFELWKRLLRERVRTTR